MKFQVGHEKAGGRAKGVPNRRTRYLHEVLEAHGFSVVENLMELLPKLDHTTQAGVLLRLLPFLYPQRKPVDCSLGTGEQIPDDPVEPELKPVRSLAAAVEELKQLYPNASIMRRELETFK